MKINKIATSIKWQTIGKTETKQQQLENESNYDIKLDQISVNNKNGYD